MIENPRLPLSTIAEKHSARPHKTEEDQNLIEGKGHHVSDISMTSTGYESALLDQRPEPVSIIDVEPQTEKTHTLILSDLHLGSEVSRAHRILDLLKSYEFKRLIILGDAFDDTRFERLKRSHFKVLSYINGLSSPKKDIEVIWIAGNHDGPFLNVVSTMLGVKIFDEYEFTVGEKSYLAIHGHQFDGWMENYPRVSVWANRFYQAIQRRESNTQRFSRYLKRKSKTWLKCSEHIANEAVKYAQKKGVDGVLCGHTHFPVHKPDHEGVEYLNTGCWTDIPSTFVTIDADGAKLHSV